MRHRARDDPLNSYQNQTVLRLTGDRFSLYNSFTREAMDAQPSGAFKLYSGARRACGCPGATHTGLMGLLARDGEADGHCQ